MFELGEGLRKIRRPMVRVQSAGVRKHPHKCTGQPLILQTDDGSRPLERGSICADADNRNDARTITSDQALQPFSARAKLLGRELIGGNRLTRHKVGDAAVVLE